MSRYDNRSGDPAASYRDKRGDGFGSAPSYSSSGGVVGEYYENSRSKRDYESKHDFDGLTPFEKNFYVESLSVASMTGHEVEAYR